MHTVIFVTTVFEGVENGPGVYGRYLWERFKQVSYFNYVVLAPDVTFDDPNIVSFQGSEKSSIFYQNMENRLKEFLRSRPDDEIIIHLNIPHSLSSLPPGSKSIIQANDYDAAMLSRDVFAAAKANGLKRLFSLFWRRFREEKIYKDADIILANSKYTADILKHEYPLKSDKVRVVYKAVDIELFARPVTVSKSHQLSLEEDTFKLLFVGSNWKRKGLDVLHSAVEALVNAGHNIEVLVVGPEAFDSSKEIRKLIADSKVAKCFHFLGRISRSDLPPYYWAADLAVLPSREEALGVAVIESLAAGLPVVASKVGGIPEIIETHQVGLLVPSGEAGALAEAISSLMEDTVLYERMRANTQKRAADFSKIKMLDEIERIYMELFD